MACEHDNVTIIFQDESIIIVFVSKCMDIVCSNQINDISDGNSLCSHQRTTYGLVLVLLYFYRIEPHSRVVYPKVLGRFVHIMPIVFTCCVMTSLTKHNSYNAYVGHFKYVVLKQGTVSKAYFQIFLIYH